MDLAIYEATKDLPLDDWDAMNRAVTSTDPLVQRLLKTIVEYAEWKPKYNELKKRFDELQTDYFKLHEWSPLNGKPPKFDQKPKKKYGELLAMYQHLEHAYDALRKKKTPSKKGGRPRYGQTLDECRHVEQMKTWRRKKWSFRKIAQRLNDDNVPTASGKSWHPETVKKIIERKPKRIRKPPRSN